MEIKQVLEKQGFKGLEVDIYLYLLKNGAKSQQQVSDDNSILRQTVYDIMGKMEIKGLISSALFGKRKVYSAIEPNILLKRLKEKQEEFIEILPKLEKMKSLNISDFYSENFIGMAGLKNLFNLTLDSSTEVLWIANNDSHIQVFQDFYWENYAVKRIGTRVHLKMIVEDNTKNSLWKTSKKLLREIRANNFAKSLTSSFVLFEDKIILYSIKQNQLFGVFIQSSSLNKMFEKIFLDYWNNSRKI